MPGGAKRKLEEIDLSDVPDLEPILKDRAVRRMFDDNTRSRPVQAGASKYMGVYFEKANKKWKAQIMIQGKVRHLGFFKDEEIAARCYAKAAYKFKSTRNPSMCGGLDLSGVPDQPLILKKNGSGYQGVTKRRTKWQARISKNKNSRVHLGSFDTAQEAAQIYARAYFLLKIESPIKPDINVSICSTEESNLGPPEESIGTTTSSEHDVQEVTKRKLKKKDPAPNKKKPMKKDILVEAEQR